MMMMHKCEIYSHLTVTVTKSLFPLRAVKPPPPPAHTAKRRLLKTKGFWNLWMI